MSITSSLAESVREDCPLGAPQLQVARISGRDGVRVFGTRKRYFLWEGDQLLAELDANGTGRIGEYAYYPGINQPLALITGSGSTPKTRYITQDVMGNVTGVVDSLTAAQTLIYDAFGVTVASGSLGDTNRLRWKGLVWEGDSTQLYYMRNRWYDPQTGRFVTEDPTGLDGGVNLYAFGGEDPIGGSDPSGLDYLCQPVVKKGTIYATCVHIDEGSAFGPGLEYEPNVISGGPIRQKAGDLNAAERLISRITPDALVPIGFCIDRFTSTPFGIGTVVNLGISTAVVRKPSAPAGLATPVGRVVSRRQLLRDSRVLPVPLEG